MLQHTPSPLFISPIFLSSSTQCNFPKSFVVFMILLVSSNKFRQFPMKFRIKGRYIIILGPLYCRCTDVICSSKTLFSFFYASQQEGNGPVSVNNFL